MVKVTSDDWNPSCLTSSLFGCNRVLSLRLVLGHTLSSGNYAKKRFFYIPNVPASVSISCQTYFTVNRSLSIKSRVTLRVSNLVWIDAVYLNVQRKKWDHRFEFNKRTKGSHEIVNVRRVFFFLRKSNANLLESGSRCRLSCDEKAKSPLVRWFSSISVPFQFIQRHEATLIFLWLIFHRDGRIRRRVALCGACVMRDLKRSECYSTTAMGGLRRSECWF